MRLPKIGKRVLAVTAAAAVLTGVAAGPAAAHGRTGTRSLGSVLLADRSGFDHNRSDFDILGAAVKAVLKAKPNSPVRVLTDGRTALTAFLPNDLAFERLVADLKSSHVLPGEKQAFGAVAGLGIDTVEAVLLYHVVPGATISGRTALKSDGAKLKTASGATVTVDVTGRWFARRVQLVDADRNDRDATVVKYDVNRGNRQLGHVVDRVLRPIDLP